MPSSVSLFATPKSDEDASDFYKMMASLASSIRPACSSLSLSANNWTQDEDLMTDAEGELYHDEKTLLKVTAGILRALPNCPGDTVQNIINGILNEGILFREQRR